ncbi:diaminopimelate decarboxylase [Helicobacter didelphidarum]|uniref:Diaminopimelate decarboxylase n=1 Tax=Helicobacter didelphidarum TaxID=2040648 RepID=A0A3D8IL12_9HELI|nr:diaminopimelate decarboxylase [Helicobacter didelphidarum]RDU65261.1 diaminopimelate decarboxylase [Helicobacter didelphidarum]
MKYFTTNYDFHELAKQYGTPLYLYDIDTLSGRYNEIKDSFSGFKSLVCYALKANSNLSIIKVLAKLGSGADCVSLNEVKRAIIAGIPTYKIIFSGVGKEDYEIEEALRLGILFLNVESEMELLRIENLAKKIAGEKKIGNQHSVDFHQENTLYSSHSLNQNEENIFQARISIRVNPDVNAKTHPYISTGLHENKFGLDIQTAKRLYLYAHKSPFLNPIGIHYHIGSQILDDTPLLESSIKILELTKSLLSANIKLKFFDIGGGFGISYHNEKPFAIQEYISNIIRKIDALDLTTICEPGRFIMGNSGAILTRVIGEKYTPNKRFVIVDCAMNDLIRPSLYHAYHNIAYLGSSLNQCKQIPTNTESLKHNHNTLSTQSNDAQQMANDSQSQEFTKCDIVGAICESGDYLARDRELPKCHADDLLLIESSGAYGYSMASNYNSRMKPAEVALFQGNHYLIKEREKFDESVENELANLKEF